MWSYKGPFTHKNILTQHITSMAPMSGTHWIHGTQKQILNNDWYEPKQKGETKKKISERGCYLHAYVIQCSINRKYSYVGVWINGWMDGWCR